MIWHLLLDGPYLDDFKVINIPWEVRLVSKAWNALTNSNVLWLAHQVARNDVVGTLANRLLVVEETLELAALTCDIWDCSVVVLDDVVGE
jgi:hypothetical protein